MALLQIAVLMESLVEGLDNHLFDHRAGKTVGVCRQRVQVKTVGRAFSPLQMDGKDLTAFGSRGQIDKENFVQPPFAQELRRQHKDVVGGGGDKDRLFLFLKPRQKSRKHTGGRAGVRGVRRLRARQSLRSGEHTSELQSLQYLVCRLLVE